MAGYVLGNRPVTEQNPRRPVAVQPNLLEPCLFQSVATHFFFLGAQPSV